MSSRRRQIHVANEGDTTANEEDAIADAADDDTLRANLRRVLTCPICLEVLHNPVTTLCGHTYCSMCMHDLLSRSRRVAGGGPASCPECRSIIDERDLKSSAVVVGNVIELAGAESSSSPSAAASRAHAHDRPVQVITRTYANNILTAIRERRYDEVPPFELPVQLSTTGHVRFVHEHGRDLIAEAAEFCSTHHLFHSYAIPARGLMAYIRTTFEEYAADAADEVAVSTPLSSNSGGYKKRRKSSKRKSSKKKSSKKKSSKRKSSKRKPTKKKRMNTRRH